MTRKSKGTVSFVTDLKVQQSFNETSLTLSREFRREGLFVTISPRYTPMSSVRGADILLMHPGVTAGPVVMGKGDLAGRFKLKGVIDVLNYSHPGPKQVFQLTFPFWDFVVVHHVSEGLLGLAESGRVVRWDLGLPKEYATGLGIVHAIPRVLIWAQNGGWKRKGHDLHASILAKAQRRGYKFEVFIKTPFLERALNEFSEVHEKRILMYYLDRTQLLRLYDNMDVLMHLQRGGGWEMCPQEAIGRGLVAILPNAGSPTHYANERNAVMVEAHPWRPPQKWILKDSGGCDAGEGYEADADDALDAFLAVVNEWPKPGLNAKRNAPVFYNDWRIDKVMPRNWGALADALHVKDGVLARIRS